MFLDYKFVSFTIDRKYETSTASDTRMGRCITPKTRNLFRESNPQQRSLFTSRVAVTNKHFHSGMAVSNIATL